MARPSQPVYWGDDEEVDWEPEEDLTRSTGMAAALRDEGLVDQILREAAEAREAAADGTGDDSDSAYIIPRKRLRATEGGVSTAATSNERRSRRAKSTPRAEVSRRRRTPVRSASFKASRTGGRRPQLVNLPDRVRASTLARRSDELFEAYGLVEAGEEAPVVRDLTWLQRSYPLGRFNGAPRGFCRRFWWDRTQAPELVEAAPCMTEYPADVLAALWERHEVLRFGLGSRAEEKLEDIALATGEPSSASSNFQGSSSLAGAPKEEMGSGGNNRRLKASPRLSRTGWRVVDAAADEVSDDDKEPSSRSSEKKAQKVLWADGSLVNARLHQKLAELASTRGSPMVFADLSLFPTSPGLSCGVYIPGQRLGQRRKASSNRWSVSQSVSELVS